jgi:hypothetical protein
MNTLENYVKNSNTFAVLYLHFTLWANHFQVFTLQYRISYSN